MSSETCKLSVNDKECFYRIFELNSKQKELYKAYKLQALDIFKDYWLNREYNLIL